MPKGGRPYKGRKTKTVGSFSGSRKKSSANKVAGKRRGY